MRKPTASVKLIIITIETDANTTEAEVGEWFGEVLAGLANSFPGDLHAWDVQDVQKEPR